MADWKELLQEVLLADGAIDSGETALLKKELLADGKIDSEEVDFLVDLRNKAKTLCPEFTKFFFEALKSNILEDGVVDDDEAERLRKILYADGVIDADEKKFLADLKNGAKKVSPKFDKLYNECMK